MSSDHSINRATCGAPRPAVIRPRALLGVVALACAAAAAMPSPAGATNSFTLDTNPASGAFAAVAVDSTGSGYFGWERNGGSSPNVTMFCKVPRGGTCTNAIALPTGPAISDGATAVDGAFPVLGGASTVYVVGQRFIQQDVVVWTSTDGGSTFGPPAEFPSGVSAGSDQSDVLAAPAGGFYISSDNPGLAFTSVPASAGPAPVTDLTPGGSAGDSTLGLAGGGMAGNLTGNPVEAFHMGGSPQTINFRSYSGTGNLNDQASWTATAQVTSGMQPSLAGGPSGLFLASEDLDSFGHYSQVNVRKYTGSGFGQPIMTLQTDSAYDNGGRIFQTPGGRVLVAWVGPALADNGVPIRLYDTGTTGGASFTRVGNVAEGAPNDAIYLIRLAAADDGQGFVSFHEIGSGLLRVADLNPIKSPTSVAVNGIIFVGGQILINTGFNTPGTVLVTTQITNALQILIPPGPPARTALASAARKANRCKAGQVLLKVGHKKKCLSNSFGTTTRTIPAPGAYKIKLAPNAAARRALARGKTLHVKVTLTFKPTSGGKPVVRNTKITIKGHKAGKK